MTLETLFSSFFSDPWADPSSACLGLLGVLALLVLIELFKFMLALSIRTLHSEPSLDTGQDDHPLLFSIEGEVIFPRMRTLSVQPFQLRMSTVWRRTTGAFPRASPTSWAILVVTSLVWKLFSSVRWLKATSRRWFSFRPRMRRKMIGMH